MAISRARDALHDRAYRLDAIEEALTTARNRTRYSRETDVHDKIGEALQLLASHQQELEQEFSALDAREAEAGIYPFDAESMEQLAAVAPGRRELAHAARRAAA